MRKILSGIRKDCAPVFLVMCLAATGLQMPAMADYGYVQTENQESTPAADDQSEDAVLESQTDPSYTDPGSYVLEGSDSCYLTSDDISGLSSQELCYARNEIYARHGLLFSSAELQQYFDQKSWYWGSVSPGQFSDSVFNEYETANISLIQSREKEVGEYVPDQTGYSYTGVGAHKAGAASQTAGSEYIFADSDSRYLTDADIAPLSLQMICYAKNEIFARRGYIFRSRELKDYFGSKSWYTPTVPAASFSFSVFNEYEAANVDLLSSYEYYRNPNGYALY